MADHTITLTDSQNILVAAKAVEAGVTIDQFVQASASKEADNIVLVATNDWWASLNRASKKTIYDANQ
jgi:hypothetical protein